MNNYDCLLFDLDGTLLDSRDIVITAVHATAEQFVPGVYSKEAVLARFGESFTDFLAEWGSMLEGRYERDDVYQAYLAQAKELEEKPVPLFAGVKESLSRLVELGYRVGLVTNKQREITLVNLEAAGIGGLFEIVVTLDDVENGKPSPEPLEKAMAHFGVSPARTLMVGDSIYDLEAARAARAACAILEWYGPGELAESSPDYRFASLDELLERLTKAQAEEKGRVAHGTSAVEAGGKNV